jgi:hypothetical protein
MRPAIDKLRDSFGTIWEVSNQSLRIDLVSRGLGRTYLDQRLARTNNLCRNSKALEFVSFSKIPLTFGLFHRKEKQL